MQEQQACDTFVSANSKQTIDYASSIYLANYPKYAEVTYVTAYYTQAVQKYSKQIGHANVINYFRYANEYNHAANRHKYSKYVCPTYAFRFSGRFSGQVGGVSVGTSCTMVSKKWELLMPLSRKYTSYKLLTDNRTRAKIWATERGQTLENSGSGGRRCIPSF